MAIFGHLPSALARSHEKLTSKPKLRANSSFPMVPLALPQTKVLPSSEPKSPLPVRMILSSISFIKLVGTIPRPCTSTVHHVLYSVPNSLVPDFLVPHSLVTKPRTRSTHAHAQNG